MATLLKRAPGFEKNPDYRITFERSPRRVRVKFAGEYIADSTDAHLLFETRHLPVYYFPRKDVRFDLLVPTDHRTYCPYKGDCSYFSIPLGGARSVNAIWTYEQPFEAVAAIGGFLAFYPERVDEISIEPRAT